MARLHQQEIKPVCRVQEENGVDHLIRYDISLASAFALVVFIFLR